MRIMVTGGAGFIGSHYVRTAIGGGFPDGSELDITVLDQLTYAGFRHNLPASHPQLTFVTGDILDRALVRELMSGQDAVVHFAAETHVDRSIADATAFVRTNVEGTQVLLAAAQEAGVDRVVQGHGVTSMPVEEFEAAAVMFAEAGVLKRWFRDEEIVA